MALPVTDVTCLEGRAGELVVKELAVTDSQSNRVSIYVFKKPYSWMKVPGFNAPMNCAIDRGCKWNYVDILSSELESIVNRAASSAVVIYWFGPQKSEFIRNLIDRSYRNQLGSQQLAQLAFPVVTCTLHVISLNISVPYFHVLSIQCAGCPTKPNSYCFQMRTLLERVYFWIRRRQCMWPSLWLRSDTANKNLSSSRTVVLNQIQWPILVTFKDHIPKNVMHEHGDWRHTLDLYCRQYIRVSLMTAMCC
jgi:hypothetical protein